MCLYRQFFSKTGRDRWRDNMRTKKGSERKPRQRWHERTADRDIRYRGPLNYQHFQILGWLCIAASQLVFILGLANRMNMLPGRYAWMQEPARIMSWMALPFLLTANFAQIMNGKKSYKSLLIRNFCAAAAVWAGYAFILHRYIVGTVDMFNDGTVASLDVVTRFMVVLTSSGLLKIGSPGVLAFNVFVDLFLCTLLMFFLNYKPKKIFTGKWRYVFRAFALLPIACEVGCIVLKVMASRFQIEVSPYLYPLFTVKPTMTFVLFIVLAFYIKTREWRFCRHGRTHEEYAAFLHTRKNSWDFSLFLAVALIVVSVLDFVLFARITDMEMAHIDAEAAAASITPVAMVIGFGDSIMLWLLAPLVLLFSYTREPRNPALGMVIPVAAIGIIALLYLEAGHQALPYLNIPRMNMEGFVTGETAEDEASGVSLMELLTADPAAEGIPAEEPPSEGPPAEAAAITEENSPDHSPAAENPDEKTN